MADATYDLTCKQGATLSRVLTVTDDAGSPIDLTGWHAKMQVRKTHRDATALIELTDDGPDARITITPLLGKLSLKIEDEDTLTLPAVSAVYDLLLTDALGNKTCILEGKFVVTAGVTR